MKKTHIWDALPAAAALVVLGCAPPATAPDDGGGTDTTTGAVTYTKDAQPIFMVKCMPCHTGQGLGNHNIGTTYADALRDVSSVDSMGCWNDTDPNMHTMPKKIGECASILINSGFMPFGAGCGNTTPLDPAACLSSDQKATIAAWVAGGLKQ